MLVQSARGVARGPVARLVAQGARNTHEWTPAKAELLEVVDFLGTDGAITEIHTGGNFQEGDVVWVQGVIVKPANGRARATGDRSPLYRLQEIELVERGK